MLAADEVLANELADGEGAISIELFRGGETVQGTICWRWV